MDGILKKDELRAEFSRERPELYRVPLFEEKGFIRKVCKSCGRYFWTLDEGREYCPNQPCSRYQFIGNPSGEKLNYVATWKKIRSFFEGEGHTYVKRYPVVARWRPDLYFTVASIIDFQRIEGGRVIFEFPANPLIVPQMSLRFNDVINVGVTGRHYTSFCMVGQHAMNDQRGYWKERTIDLDYHLLTSVFGISPMDIVFVEDIWVGYGAFGYSLEFFVKNLELGNAVFTEFEGTPSSYRRFSPTIVDMGAGLERFVWLLNGTPTSYDAVFGEVEKKFIDRNSISLDVEGVNEFFKEAGQIDLSEVTSPQTVMKGLLHSFNYSDKQLDSLYKMQDMYALLDHTRTLLFALVDGGLPSNVGGGYNLRVILRRSLDIIRRNAWSIDIYELMEWHSSHLKDMYPELGESIEAAREVIKVESDRYMVTSERAGKIAEGYRHKQVSVDELVKLYESDGITPELFQRAGIISEVPAEFYEKLTERHGNPHPEAQPTPIFNGRGVQKTELLFYQNKYLFQFRARVLKVDGPYVMLDRTAFYARSGGQEPDTGYIEGKAVVDVVKSDDVIAHRVDDGNFREGQEVECSVNSKRRLALMRHHSATHILNGAARELLGPWVWQNSAFKDEQKARLDITHHSHLTKEQVRAIEDLANSVVMNDLEMRTEVMHRNEAESKYGFKIYQGGVTPSDTLRIVSIKGFDTEACGGTHCDRTGQVGPIKVLRAERIQDGVERLEFVAGEAALDYFRSREDSLSRIAAEIRAPDDYSNDLSVPVKDLVSKLKVEEEKRRRLLTILAGYVSGDAELSSSSFMVIDGDGLDSGDHIYLGDGLTRDRDLVYLGVWKLKQGYGYVIFAGGKMRKPIDAKAISDALIKEFGGRGGGRGGRMAQGAVDQYDGKRARELIGEFVGNQGQGVRNDSL
jgi:alanyl-tRNA synthetase